MSMKCNPIG